MEPMANRIKFTGTTAAPLFAAMLGLLPACSGSQPAEPVAAAAPPAAAPAPATTPAKVADGAPAPELGKQKAITEASYGNVGGKEVKLYTLKNKNGLTLKVTNYGCIVTE